MTEDLRRWDSPAELMRYWSTRVAVVLLGLAEYVTMMSPEELAKLVAQYPVISKLVPVFAFAVWMGARARRQGGPK